MIAAIKSVVFALATTVCLSVAVGQTNASVGLEENLGPTAPTPLQPEFGLLEEGQSGWTSIGSNCRKGAEKKIPSGMVVLVGYETCNIGASYSQSYVRIFSGGIELLVETSVLAVLQDAAERVKNRTTRDIADSTALWKRYAMELRVQQLEKMISTLRRMSIHGIVLLKSSVYDVSEHTEGTGFRVQVLNPTKKAIKYVTFEVIGLNAVNDLVRDRVRGSATMRLRGIGPIEPDETASYDQDYMWHTDVVEYHKIASIRVEYMDGTSKTVRDVDKVRLNMGDVELLASQ